MWTSAVLFVMLLMVLEFSFSRTFAQNALGFMMAFKVVWVRGPSTISRRHARAQFCAPRWPCLLTTRCGATDLHGVVALEDAE